MLMKGETSISILLVSLLLCKLSYCHVARWGQLEDNFMETSLRRVLEKLVTLASPRGQITRMAKDFEVEELLGITKRALFSKSRQWETRRHNFMTEPNPSALPGPDPGNFSGVNVHAGIMAGPKGMWASVGAGIGPGAVKSTGENGTWFGQLGQGNGEQSPSQQNVIWTMTWAPNPSSTPSWITGTPRLHETTTFSWFAKPSSTWPNWATVKPTKWDFGTTHQSQWNTNIPIWFQNSTINANWFYSTTTQRPWFFAPKAAGSDPLSESLQAKPNWDTFTKKIPPRREANTTILEPVPTTA